MATYRSYITGPRWAGIGEALRKAAMKCDLDISIQEERGWVRSTYFFRLDGNEGEISAFKKWLMASVRTYEKEDC